MCLTLQTLAVTCWLHLVAGEIQTGFLTFFKNPERDLIQPLLSQKHSSELRLTRTCAGFNGIMFTQVLHLPDSCWFGYDNSWPSWERTESFYSNLNDLSQKTASSNMQPNSCLRGRIFKPSLCCFSFQIDIVFLEVMSRDMVFIKCSNGNAASQITCHCNCPVLRALFNGRINTGKRGRRAELTHYLVSSPCDPPETLPGIKFPFRPKLTHLFLSQSSKKMNRKMQDQVLFGVRLRYHWPTLKKWCQKKAVFHKRKIVWKGVGEKPRNKNMCWLSFLPLLKLYPSPWAGPKNPQALSLPLCPLSLILPGKAFWGSWEQAASGARAGKGGVLELQRQALFWAFIR